MSKNTHFRILPGDAWIRGVRETEKGYSFSIAVPDGAEAELLLYTDASRTQPCQVIPLPEEERIGEVSAVTVEMPHEGEWAYAYRINGRVMPDWYSNNIRSIVSRETGRKELHALTASAACARTKPLGIAYEDAVIYKAHVRGLTKKKPGGVRHPGTFLGILEFIPYLKNLGINMLMLMPPYEFCDTPEHSGEYRLDGEIRVLSPDPVSVRKNYWGYTGGLYFSPKLNYSAGDDPCREFADMVDALHEAGIGCIPEFWFDPSEDPRLVTDVLRHWLLHYHVDGFHLLGGGGWIHAAAADPFLKKTWILNDSFDEAAIGVRNPRKDRTLGIMNRSYEETMRRFLKGDQEISPEESAWMLRRNDAACAYVNYFADQDGFTMADMVMYGERHNEENGEQNRDGCAVNYSWNCGEEGPSHRKSVRKLRERQLRNAWMLLLTSQGTPMLYAGDEVMNSQGGNNNAWCQDNDTGWVVWKKNAEVRRMQEFVMRAAAFRAAHPVLRQKLPLRMEDYRAAGFPDVSYHSRTAWMSQTGETKSGLGVLLCGAYGRKQGGEEDDTLYVIYNMYWKPQDFAVPDLPKGMRWLISADTSEEEGFFDEPRVLCAEDADEKLLTVPERSVVILTAVSEKSLSERLALSDSDKAGAQGAASGKKVAEKAASGKAAAGEGRPEKSSPARGENKVVRAEKNMKAEA